MGGNNAQGLRTCLGCRLCDRSHEADVTRPIDQSPAFLRNRPASVPRGLAICGIGSSARAAVDADGKWGQGHTQLLLMKRVLTPDSGVAMVSQARALGRGRSRIGDGPDRQ